MRHLGLVIFLLFVLIITAIYPSKFAVIEYFENKKDASGNPVPKSVKTTSKSKSEKKPESKPEKKPESKSKSGSGSGSGSKNGSDNSDNGDLQPNTQDVSYQNYPVATHSEKERSPTLNEDKNNLKQEEPKTTKVYKGIKGLKEEKSDEWILKSSLLPCSCPSTTCSHNLKNNSSEDYDFALLNQGVEKGTDIGPFSRPLVADVKLPNAAINKEWVRTNLMAKRPPTPYLTDLEVFTY